MVMPNRSLTSEKYRFGFNGKENDNEVKGTANQQDYGMRIYDPRVARFLSVDPLTQSYPELTPYQFASNSCIALIDIDGKEGGFLDDLVDYAVAKINKVIAKTIEAAVTATVNYVKEEINKIEVKTTPFVKAEVKSSVGARVTGTIKKVLGGDVNAGSVETARLTFEVNKDTKKLSDVGEWNLLGKDGKTTTTDGVSGSVSYQIGTVPVGGGAGMGSSKTTGKDGSTSETTSQTVGVSIGLGNLSGTHEKTTDSETGTIHNLTGSVGVGGSQGVVGTYDYVIEAGIKISITTDKKE